MVSEKTDLKTIAMKADYDNPRILKVQPGPAIG